MDNQSQTTASGLTILGVKELLQTFLSEGEHLSLNLTESNNYIENYNKKYLDLIKQIKSPNLTKPILVKLFLLERNMKSITSTHNDLVQSIKNSRHIVTQLIEDAQLFIPQKLPKLFNKTRRRGDTPRRERSSNNIFTRPPGTLVGGYKKVYSKKRTNKH